MKATESLFASLSLEQLKQRRFLNATRGIAVSEALRDEITRRERIEYLRKLVAQQQHDSGWNDAGIYNRDWKKELAATKRQLAQATKGI